MKYSDPNASHMLPFWHRLLFLNHITLFNQPCYNTLQVFVIALFNLNKHRYPGQNSWNCHTVQKTLENLVHTSRLLIVNFSSIFSRSDFDNWSSKLLIRSTFSSNPTCISSLSRSSDVTVARSFEISSFCFPDESSKSETLDWNRKYWHLHQLLKNHKVAN